MGVRTKAGGLQSAGLRRTSRSLPVRQRWRIWETNLLTDLPAADNRRRGRQEITILHNRKANRTTPASLDMEIGGDGENKGIDGRHSGGSTPTTVPRTLPLSTLSLGVEEGVFY